MFNFILSLKQFSLFPIVLLYQLFPLQIHLIIYLSQFRILLFEIRQNQLKFLVGISSYL